MKYFAFFLTFGLVCSLGWGKSGSPLSMELTELGTLKALLVLDKNVLENEPLIAESLSDADLRLFPSARTAQGRMNHDIMRKAGKEAGADLVVHVAAGSRPKNQMGEFKLYEGEATVQVFSPVTGEVLVMETARDTGERHVDEVHARRSARENALSSALAVTKNKLLARSDRLIVHLARINGVLSDEHLLAIVKYIGKLDVIHHVRELKYDPSTGQAVLEIIAAPGSIPTWKTHLERMPKVKVNVTVKPNPDIRKKYPSWFK